MRRLLAVLALALTLTACDDNDLTPTPGPVTVNAPDLVKLKQDAGIRTCVPGTAAGSKLPDLTLPCLGGGPSVDLSKVIGPMIIDVFKSGCVPCQEELPALQKFDQDHGTTVPVVGIDFEDSYPASALDLAKQTGVTFPLLADSDGEVNARKPFPRFRGVPYVLFVDDTGDITVLKIGGVKSEQELVALTEHQLGTSL